MNIDLKKNDIILYILFYNLLFKFHHVKNSTPNSYMGWGCLIPTSNSQYQLGVKFNSILTLFTWRKHRIPHLFQCQPPSLSDTPIASPGCYLSFSPFGYRSEVLMTSSLCLINLLERLIVLRETVYLLDY